MKNSIDPEIQKKWSDALRSGNHKQWCNQLHYNDCDCCLGVLSLVAIPEYKRKIYSYPSECSILTDETEQRYIRYNDSDHMNFSQIADEVDLENIANNIRKTYYHYFQQVYEETLTPSLDPLVFRSNQNTVTVSLFNKFLNNISEEDKQKYIFQGKEAVCTEIADYIFNEQNKV